MKLVKRTVEVRNTDHVWNTLVKTVTQDMTGIIWNKIQEPEEKRRWINVEHMGGSHE